MKKTRSSSRDGILPSASPGLRRSGRSSSVVHALKTALVFLVILLCVSFIVLSFYRLPTVERQNSLSSASPSIEDDPLALLEDPELPTVHSEDSTAPPSKHLRPLVNSSACLGGSDALALNPISLWRKAKKGEPRILCLVFTIKKNHDRVRAIRRSWGQECDELLFISNEADEEIGVIKTRQHSQDNYENLHDKVIWAFWHVLHEYKGKVDWIYKADDDTHVIMENLRRYLLSPDVQRDKDRPLYLGRRLKNDVLSIPYNSGGAGYVLNWQAFEKVTRSLNNEDGKCNLSKHWRFSNFPEDALIGWCLSRLDVFPRDTRDDELRERFHFFPPGIVYSLPTNDTDWWYTNVKRWGAYYRNGSEIFSPSTIAFHYVDSPKYHYGIYNYLHYCKRGLQPPE